MNEAEIQQKFRTLVEEDKGMKTISALIVHWPE